MTDEQEPVRLSQCEYGTAKAGNVNQERCEKEATEKYIGLDEEIYLCNEHFAQFHRGDNLSGTGDW